jgi:hypothetical protein
MDGDLLTRFWTDLVGRLSGPLTFRLILQPAMSILMAVRDGMKDAREDRPPYFWAIFTHSGQRFALLREGWKAVSRIIALGVTMDVVYQLIVFRTIRPLELVVVVLLLSFAPYLLWRGPVNRMARHWIHPRRATVR